MSGPITKAFLTLALLLVAGCGNLKAATPSAANPGHCLAAFNHARFWFEKGDALALELTAEAMFYYTAANLKRAGALDRAYREGREFTSAFGNDAGVMGSLLESCGKSVEQESGFAGNQAYWLRLARLQNKHCQQRPECRITE